MEDFAANECRYLIQILPAAVVAPLYFQGKIDFGVINQSSSAFNHILTDVSLIVYQVRPISEMTNCIPQSTSPLYLLDYFDVCLFAS